MKLFSLLTAGALVSEANKIRTPSERQNKNELFLKKWFGNNCKGEEHRGQDDAVRPFRCQNKFDRYMKEWQKLRARFLECGHFDLEAAVTGKKNGRKRRDDYGVDYAAEWEAFENQEGDGGLFDNDLWDLTNEQLAEIEDLDQSGSDGDDSLKNINYFSFFEDFAEDYEDVTDGADYSTTDEENAKVRTRQDLRPQEQRALSADPSRSHKQLSNAMKQYAKRFLDDCEDNAETLQRLTSYYKQANELHKFVMNVVAEKYERMRERAARRASRL